MTIETISAVSTHADAESPIVRLLVAKAALESVEYTALDWMHDFLTDAVAGVEKVEDTELLYGSEACAVLTKDQAERFVEAWLDENKLQVGQSISNLLSENRRKSFTDTSLKKGQQKGNRHKYGACPYSEGRPLSYFKAVLLRWLEENVRPEANAVGLSS